MSVYRLTEEEYRQKIAAKTTRAKAATVLVVHKVRTAHLTLPWPPTANTNVRHGNGKHYLTDKHKSFRGHVAVAVTVAGLHKEPLVGKLKITMQATPPDKRHRDLDNLLKPILDALQHAGLYANDSAIDDLRIIRSKGTPGTVTVFVETI